MEVEHNQEALINLGTLRAGMSYISAQKEQADQIKAELAKKNSEYDSKKRVEEDKIAIPYEVEVEEEVNGSKQTVKKKKIVKGTDVDIDENYNTYLKEIKSLDKRDSLGYLFLAIIMFIINVAGIVLKHHIFSDWVMYVLAAFSIFWFLGIILFISSRKDEKVLYKKTGCYQKETIKRLEAAEELRKFSIELENERKGTIETYQKQIDAVLQEAKQAYLALKKSFEKILDERDWQYVDVLIYYFQTARATTVKESLQLLDRQLQTNQIVDAVQQTSVAITESINQFKDTFVTCATQIISNQDEMISQMRVQTALLSKICASSSSLASDVGYVKEYY